MISINQLLENFKKDNKDNIWGADLADMQLISKCKKKNLVLLCVINIFSKYTWVIPLNDKKIVTITNAFQKSLNDSKIKLNKKAVTFIIDQ